MAVTGSSTNMAPAILNAGEVYIEGKMLLHFRNIRIRNIRYFHNIIYIRIQKDVMVKTFILHISVFQGNYLNKNVCTSIYYMGLCIFLADGVESFVSGVETGSGTVQYRAVQYSTVQCSTVQYSTVHDSTLKYTAVVYNSVH